MIKAKINDAVPDDACYTLIIGSDVYYYFAGDQEVIDMEKEQADGVLRYQRAQAKEKRKQNVNNITVTASTGNIFNGDELSQQRMQRAIEIMNDVETIEWILADNTIAITTRAELREALRMAFLKQSSITVGDH